jgi:ribose transport system substrate-binding protein
MPGVPDRRPGDSESLFRFQAMYPTSLARRLTPTSRILRLLRIAGLVVAAGAAAALPACGGRSGPARTKVAFVSNNAHEFWTIAEAGARKADAEFNVQTIFKRPQSGSAAEQKQIIEDVLAQGVQAIAVSVIDPENQHDFLNRIAERVPLITQDNDAPRTKRKCYIGTDNYTAGKAVGQLIKEVMPDGGKVAIFVGQPDPLNARQRRAGVLDELAGQKDAPEAKKYGKYELVGTYYDETNERKAKDNAADVLTKLGDEPNLCMVGLWAYNPPAILSAVQDAGKTGKVKIVGFDENDNTLIGVKDGSIYATVVQQPFEFGYQAMTLMAKVLAGDRSGIPSTRQEFIPTRVLRQNDVDEFRKKLTELRGR